MEQEIVKLVEEAVRCMIMDLPVSYPKKSTSIDVVFVMEQASVEYVMVKVSLNNV